jgi:RimJ/RimL family protein N-acetyltransferase
MKGVSPVTLTSDRVRLEPLEIDRHFSGLRAIGLEAALWEWTLDHCETEADLRRYLERSLADQAAGRTLPFVTIDIPSGRVAGCTHYLNIEPRHRRLEIGSTWVGLPFQRTYVNTEAKYLMLQHAFEVLGMVRVELKTNALNRRSRQAMLRLGCKEEGTLRRHAVSDRGVFRDTVYYSILDNEWPDVKERIAAMLREPRSLSR